MKRSSLESPLSARTPKSYSRKKNKKARARGPVKEVDDIADVGIDEEALLLVRKMEKLNVSEKKAADKTVLGYSATAISILNKFTKRPDDADNRFGGLPEDPAFLSLKFDELEVEIQMIEVVVSANGGSGRRNPDFAAYELAREQDPKFVNHPLFKVGFLRAERYNAKKAAKRILRHLREKLELFGSDKLTKDIFLSDLGDGGKKFLERGGLQILPKRDKAGRTIVFLPWIADEADSDEEILSARKAYFYFCQSLTEDDDEFGRVKGVVAIMWKVHALAISRDKKAKAFPAIWLSAPLKTSAFHVCHGPKSSFSLIKVNAFAKRHLPFWFADSYLPRLYRSHYGKPVECMYTLYEKYGCPAYCFPLNYGSPGNHFPALEGGNNSNNDGLQSSQQFHFYHVAEWLAKRVLVDDEKELLIRSIDSSDGTLDISGFVSTIGSLDSCVNSSKMTLSMAMFDSINGARAIERRRSVAVSMAGTLIGEYESPKGSSDFSWNKRGSGQRSSGQMSTVSLETLRLSDTSIIDQIPRLKDELPFDNKDDSIEQILEEIEEVGNKIGEPSPVVGGGNQIRSGSLIGNERMGMTQIDALIPECEVCLEDIKFGRGKPLQRHPGNIWFRDLIRDNFDAYDALIKVDQTQLAKSIVEQVKHERRRFLKPHPHLPKTHWFQLSDNDAREKVSNRIRSERKERHRKKKMLK